MGPILSAMADPGRTAYRGFEYQIDVSAWLAVVFLREGRRDSIVIEPLGGEDLAALDDDSGIDTRNRTVSCQSGGALIQVKSRSGGAWGNDELGEILSGRGVDKTKT